MAEFGRRKKPVVGKRMIEFKRKEETFLTKAKSRIKKELSAPELKKAVHKVKTTAAAVKKAAKSKEAKAIGSSIMRGIRAMGEAGQNFNRNYHPLIATSDAPTRKKYSSEKYRKKRKR